MKSEVKYPLLLETMKALVKTNSSASYNMTTFTPALHYYYYLQPLKWDIRPVYYSISVTLLYRERARREEKEDVISTEMCYHGNMRVPVWSSNLHHFYINVASS